MGFEFEFDKRSIWNRTGLLKVITVIIGIVDVGLTSYSYFSEFQVEQYFLAIIIIALILSLLMLLLSVLGLIDLTDSKLERIADIVFHGTLACLLFVGAFLMAINVDNYRHMKLNKAAFYDAKHKYYERIAAALIGFLNSLLYLCISIEVYGKLRRG